MLHICEHPINSSQLCYECYLLLYSAFKKSIDVSFYGKKFWVQNMTSASHQAFIPQHESTPFLGEISKWNMKAMFLLYSEPINMVMLNVVFGFFTSKSGWSWSHGCHSSLGCCTYSTQFYINFHRTYPPRKAKQLVTK